MSRVRHLPPAAFELDAELDKRGLSAPRCIPVPTGFTPREIVHRTLGEIGALIFFLPFGLAALAAVVLIPVVGLIVAPLVLILWALVRRKRA